MNDFLDISPENSHLSLLSDSHEMTNRMRVLREGTALAAEYFAYQLFTALGLPAPRATLVSIEKAKETRTYIDSEVIADFTSFQERHLDKRTQTAIIQQSTYRLDPSIYIAFLGELIIQDKDQSPCQYLIAERHKRLYRLSLDKEMASTNLLPEDENHLWTVIEKFRQQYFSHFESALEQELAFVYRLQSILGNLNILHRIFYNSRVNSTPELICYGLRDDLYAAWLKNAERIVIAYQKRYSAQFENFALRESIRKQVASKIAAQVSLDEMTALEFENGLVDDLRSKLYFDDPSSIDESLLSNESLLQKILLLEKQRLLHLTANKATEIVISAPANLSVPSYDKIVATAPLDEPPTKKRKGSKAKLNLM